MTINIPIPNFDTPVCLIIFRRPEHTSQVLAALSQVRPTRLFVVADGPRADHIGDLEACAATRDLIEKIDWPCEVMKHYAVANLGCGKRPTSGITWLFEQVEEAIILEDDCVPDPSFFHFCAEMLARYRNDLRVMHVSGCTYQLADALTTHSYFFSTTPACWGWATWRRAWKHHDVSVRNWPMLKKTGMLRKLVITKAHVTEYEMVLERAYENNGDCSYWDYQWSVACWSNSGLAIYPKSNLVSNIGFGEGATHTKDLSNPQSCLPVRALKFPLLHPEYVMPLPELYLFPGGWDLNASQAGKPLMAGLRGVLRRIARSSRLTRLKVQVRRLIPCYRNQPVGGNDCNQVAHGSAVQGR